MNVLMVSVDIMAQCRSARVALGALGLFCMVPACANESGSASSAVVPAAVAAPLVAGGSGEDETGLVAQTGSAEPMEGPSGWIRSGGAPELGPPLTERVAQTGDAATRCVRIAALMVEDAGRMMQWLGASADQSDAFERRVAASLEPSFLQRCQTLTVEQLACLEMSDNAISGIGECAVNAGRDYSTWLELPPTLEQFMPWEQADPAEIDPVGAEALAATLVGHWQAQSGTRSWTFRADGTFEEQNAGAREGRYAVTGRSRINLEYADMGGPSVYSAIVDGDTLHIKAFSGGTAQPIIDGRRALVTRTGIWRFEDLNLVPQCSGFSPRAQPVESARCQWATQGPHRMLVVTANPGPDPNFGTPGSEVRLDFLELNGFLVPRLGADLFARAATDPAQTP